MVVKLERIPGTLAREQHALAWLNQSSGIAPRLLAAGPLASGGPNAAEAPPIRCLVTERRPGSAPVTTDGWRRMGVALARLNELAAPDRTHRLPVLNAAAFAAQHAERLGDLGDRLEPFVSEIPDWQRLNAPELRAQTPLVLTHGDPGPGNYLDDGRGGTLIDWEEAHVAPRGLDVARLFFIALLGSGPEGYTPRDRQARARAAVAGYLSQTRWQPSPAEQRWWTTVAAVQFIHRRHESGNRPGPWQQAAQTLQTALITETPW